MKGPGSKPQQVIVDPPEWIGGLFEINASELDPLNDDPRNAEKTIAAYDAEWASYKERLRHQRLAASRDWIKRIQWEGQAYATRPNVA